MKFYDPIGLKRYAYLSGQFMRIMKIIILIMTTFLLQVSASSRAQITLNEKNAPLEEVLAAIKTQTGTNFLYNIYSLKKASAITVKVENATLKEVLKICFENQPLSYEIKENTVIVKESSFVNKVTDQLRSFLQGDSVIFKGRVLDAFGDPLPGASIKVKGSKKSTFTTKEGYFAIFAAHNAILEVSYIGYETQQLQMRREDAGIQIRFNMKLDERKLSEVGIVSTGYQDLPKERATGSFEVITAKQLQHSTDPNLIRRLEGLTTSMDFNNQLQPTLSTNGDKRLSPLMFLTIRGRNTLEPLIQRNSNLTSGWPLVVIDGVPSPYSIDKVNPNDVESITILKDAAAASIWGSKAGNGVIVVKTKRGRFNTPLNVSFDVNVAITDKPDLFYRNYMRVSDYIDVEMQLYNTKYPLDGQFLEDPTDPVQPQPFMSPVEEIMNDWKKGKTNLTQRDAQLAVLRGNDIRRDFTKYLLRNRVLQNYTLGIDGGSANYAYRLFGAFGNTMENAVTSGNNNISVNYSANIKVLKNLSLQPALSYSQQNFHNQPTSLDDTRVSGVTALGAFLPYNRLADDQGNPLAVSRDFRPLYLDLLKATHGERILDMSYTPLTDMKLGYNKIKNQTLNLNLNADYKISKVFSANLMYNYSWGLNETQDLASVDSYFMRRMINKFTTPPGRPTPYNRVVPFGGMYSPELGKSNNYNLRGLLNINKTWSDKHSLTAFIAMDAAQQNNIISKARYYGYDEANSRTSSNIPFGTDIYTLYNNVETGWNSEMIRNEQSVTDFKLRTMALSSNAAYTFDKRYTISGSVRKDFSSAFGDRENSFTNPFYSIGGSWQISNEKFYHADWLPNLQLRVTYGSNGNTNARYTPVPALNSSGNVFGNNGLPYYSTTQGTNPRLRTEKSKMVNLGLNFGSKNNRLSGGIEYYVRNTSDMISNANVDPSTGFNSLSLNTAAIRSHGIDVTLNSLNINTERFRWSSSLLFSYNRVKTTKILNVSKITAGTLVNLNTSFNVGTDLSRLFAYRWAGLDHNTGFPMGYVDGKAEVITSSSLTTIQNADPSTARLFGSAVPVYYGSFRNTFSYGNFSVSANFLYRLGYFRKRPPLDLADYSRLFDPFSHGLIGGEYADRWQKPGDETGTNVPALAFPLDSSRDNFYRNAEINVFKADHIRFQEINVSYTIAKSNWFIKNPRIYANVNNLGIVWKANKLGIDPDVNDFPNPRTYSLGFSANF